MWWSQRSSRQSDIHSVKENMNIKLNTFLYIVNMVLVMEYPHKENVMKLTRNNYDNWWWKLLTAWCWTLEKLYSWWRQLVIWKKNDIQKEWLSYEGCKEEEKVKDHGHDGHNLYMKSNCTIHVFCIKNQPSVMWPSIYNHLSVQYIHYIWHASFFRNQGPNLLY